MPTTQWNDLNAKLKSAIAIRNLEWKSLFPLNEDVILQRIINDLSGAWLKNPPGYQSDDSQTLYTTLHSTAPFDIKKAAIDTYMNKPENEHRTLYREIQNAVAIETEKLIQQTTKKSPASYRAHRVGQSVDKSSILVSDLGMVGMFMTLIAVPVLAVYGTIVAFSRKPMDAVKQEKLVTRLNDCISWIESDKQDVIKTINASYSQAAGKTSDESHALFTTLNGTSGIDDKWDALVDYMKVQDADGYYVNNGRKLFCIISDALDAKARTATIAASSAITPHL